MPTTTTERMNQIGDDLYEEGAYTSANSVHAITEERDALLTMKAELLAALQGARDTLRALERHYHSEMSQGYRDFTRGAINDADAVINKAWRKES